MPEQRDAKQNNGSPWRTPLLLAALVIAGGMLLFLILGPPPLAG